MTILTIVRLLRALGRRRRLLARAAAQRRLIREIVAKDARWLA